MHWNPYQFSYQTRLFAASITIIVKVTTTPRITKFAPWFIEASCGFTKATYRVFKGSPFLTEVSKIGLRGIATFCVFKGSPFLTEVSKIGLRGIATFCVFKGSPLFTEVSKIGLRGIVTFCVFKGSPLFTEVSKIRLRIAAALIIRLRIAAALIIRLRIAAALIIRLCIAAALIIRLRVAAALIRRCQFTEVWFGWFWYVLERGEAINIHVYVDGLQSAEGSARPHQQTPRVTAQNAR